MKKIFIAGTFILFTAMMYAQNVGISAPVPVEKLDVNGAIRLGNTVTNNAGTLRFSNGRFEGYDGVNWNWLNGFKLLLDTAITATSNPVLKITNLAAASNSHAIYGLANSPAGIGLLGNNVATTGTPIGVYGQMASGVSGAGVYGRSVASSVTGVNSAVYAQNDGTASGAGIAIGVFGNSVGVSGNGVGVHGVTSSNAGKGVWGLSTADNGFTYGVYGQSNSDLGYGLYGIASTGSGVYGEGSIGVRAKGTFATGYGIYSESTGTGIFSSSSADDGYSVNALATGLNGYAINATTQNTAGSGIGVSASSNALTGTGVFGLASSITGENFGIRGRNSGTDGAGVEGVALNNLGFSFGISGTSYSATGIGVYAVNTAGGKALQTVGNVSITGLGAGNGKVLTSDATGNATWQTFVTPSTNSGLEASTFASQSIPNSTTTKVIFDFEYTDDAFAFNTTTSEFTVPSSGYYHLNSAISFFTSLPSNTVVILSLYKNGVVLKRKRSTITNQSTIDISADIKLAANDIITVYISQGSGTGAIVDNGREVTYFSAYKVY